MRDMRELSASTTVSIAELEANLSLYRSALRILIRQGKTLDQVKRSICWDRLMRLHCHRPEEYGDPGLIYASLKQDIGA